jgi:hypothetical protein
MSKHTYTRTHIMDADNNSWLDDLFDKPLLDKPLLDKPLLDNPLPVAGEVWEAMMKHVLENTLDEEKLEYVDDGGTIRKIWDIGDLYDNDEIVEYIRKSDIPPEVIYTPTQLAKSSERRTKETLMDNERIRAKYNKLLTKMKELLVDNQIIRVDRERIRADRERIRADRERIWEDRERILTWARCTNKFNT